MRSCSCCCCLPASSSSSPLLRQDGPAKIAFTLTILPWSCLSPFAPSLPFPPSLTEYWTRCLLQHRVLHTRPPAFCCLRACALRGCDALRRQTRRKTASNFSTTWFGNIWRGAARFQCRFSFELQVLLIIQLFSGAQE